MVATNNVPVMIWKVLPECFISTSFGMNDTDGMTSITGWRACMKRRRPSFDSPWMLGRTYGTGALAATTEKLVKTSNLARI